jgi:hypothetical protein
LASRSSFFLHRSKFKSQNHKMVVFIKSVFRRHHPASCSRGRHQASCSTTLWPVTKILGTMVLCENVVWNCWVKVPQEGVKWSSWTQKCCVQTIAQWNVSENVNGSMMWCTMKIFLTSDYLAFFLANKLPQAFTKKC